MFRHILVPTDFSPHSERALEYAAEIARRSGADLWLLHCYYIVSAVPTPDQFLLGPSGWEEVRQRAEERLTAAVAELEGAGVKARWELVQERPGSAIPRLAEGHQIDLVVMGTHGYGGVTRAVLGSVAERIVRLAPCSVLTVCGDVPAQSEAS